MITVYREQQISIVLVKGVPFYEVSKENTMRIALPPNSCRFQNSSVAELNQHLFFVVLVCLPIIVWLDATDKVRLANYHFR